jgi:hypothetical protein
MRSQMAHERLTPEGHGVNGIRVEIGVEEGLTVPVLCISYALWTSNTVPNADLTWRALACSGVHWRALACTCVVWRAMACSDVH